jgi:hypothetical protein
MLSALFDFGALRAAFLPDRVGVNSRRALQMPTQNPFS